MIDTLSIKVLDHRADEVMDAERDEEALAESIYPVNCKCCGWWGMSDDCRYGRCPDCGERVTREF